MSTQRSGTHFAAWHLCRLAYRLPSFGEILHRAEHPELKVNDWLALTEGVAIFHYNQLLRLENPLMPLRGSQVVHLLRKNLLRTHVSDLINRARLRPTHARDATHSKSSLDFHLPLDALVDRLEERSEMFQSFASRMANLEVSVIHYEALAEDPSHLVEKLGLDQFEEASFEQSLVRTNPESLRDLLGNWKEVERALRGSPYEWMVWE